MFLQPPFPVHYSSGLTLTWKSSKGGLDLAHDSWVSEVSRKKVGYGDTGRYLWCMNPITKWKELWSSAGSQHRNTPPVVCPPVRNALFEDFTPWGLHCRTTCLHLNYFHYLAKLKGATAVSTRRFLMWGLSHPSVQCSWAHLCCLSLPSKATCLCSLSTEKPL